MSGPWTRDEYLVTLDLYLNEDDYVENQTDPRIQEVASLIGRTPGSVALRLANYRHLDPAGTQGMENTGEKCQEIWEEFYGNEERLAIEAAYAQQRFNSSETESLPKSVNGLEDIVTGEHPIEIPGRQGQQDFRKAVRDRYGDECLLCDVCEPGLLQASHILPWSIYEETRGDPANGLLLCYTHHRAFDITLFTISNDFTIIPKPGFSPQETYLQNTILEQDCIEFPSNPPSPDYLHKRNNNHVYWWSKELNS